MGIVVAIDGPSGAGKSSTAKLIAHRAGWNYLDTGALYRGITWLSLEKNEQDPQKLLQLLKIFPLKFNCDAENGGPCEEHRPDSDGAVTGHAASQPVGAISWPPDGDHAGLCRPSRPAGGLSVSVRHHHGLGPGPLSQSQHRGR